MGVRFRISAIFAFGVGALAATASQAVFAAPVTYTLQTTATGSLGGVAFTDANVVISLLSDTGTVKSLGTVTVYNSGSGTVSVAGAPASSFLVPLTVMAITAAGSAYVVSFSTFPTPPSPMLGVAMIPDFVGGGLITTPGSVVGLPGLVYPGIGYPTSGGFFSMSKVGNSVTFSSTKGQ
jgi:hypothetical protein